MWSSENACATSRSKVRTAVSMFQGAVAAAVMAKPAGLTHAYRHSEAYTQAFRAPLCLLHWQTSWHGVSCCKTGMPDVERLTRKLQRRKCSLADLCGLYRASSKLASIATALRGHADEHAGLLHARYVARHGAHLFTACNMLPADCPFQRKSCTLQSL